MNELDKLKRMLPGVEEELLNLLLEDAATAVRAMTNRADVSAYSAGIRAVACALYNKMGREGESAYSAGGVAISYQELPAAVKGILPKPLASVGGRVFEHVETKPDS